MLEIIAFVFFTKKIRTIAAEKGIEAKGWIFKLVFRWVAIELAILGLMVLFFEINFEDELFLITNIIAILLALASAFYTIKELNDQEDVLEIKEIEEEVKNFDHFR